MALWRLVETGLGRSTDPKSQGAPSELLDRAKAFALAVTYFAFAYSTFGFARGAGKSTGAQNSGISAGLMQTAAGTLALVAAGVVIVAVGGYRVYKGASRTFLDDLKGNSSDLVRRLGAVGYIAKGLVIAGAGVLVIVAASRSEPTKATGLDGALKHSGPALRSSAPDRGRHRNHHLRPLQLRHGAIHQNVSGSGGLSFDATTVASQAAGSAVSCESTVAAAASTSTKTTWPSPSRNSARCTFPRSSGSNDLTVAARPSGNSRIFERSPAISKDRRSFRAVAGRLLGMGGVIVRRSALPMAYLGEVVTVLAPGQL